MVVLAGCAFTAANVIQKITCSSLNFWSLFLIRSLIQLTLMGLINHVMIKRMTATTTSPLGPIEIRVKTIIMIGLQGILGGLLLLCIFVAVKNLHLGDASAIFFCAPVRLV